MLNEDDNHYDSVPAWDIDGFLPVIHPITLTPSPYKISSEQLIAAMGTTLERIRLLRGWLNLRRELYGIGLEDGWQWINGSFVENVEASQNRSPNDIDVVTFFYIPSNRVAELAKQHRRLWLTQFTRVEFGVDAYYVDMENLPFSEQRKRMEYWHTEWSHTRNAEEKGYLSVRLSSDDDRKALEILNFKEVR